MKKYFKASVFILFAFLFLFCNIKKESESDNDTIIEGTVTILVDETLKPIIEDQVQVFESLYNAKISIDAKPEAEIIQSLAKDSSRIAILSRTLTKEELRFFENKKIVPKIKPFAKDAIALIANKNNKDTLIALLDVVNFVQNKNESKIKGLVFDNPNSSTSRYIRELPGVESFPEENIFSFKTNEEVIKYVSENDGIVGVVGVNYLFQPMPSMKQYVDKVNVLNVKKGVDANYFSPTQNNITEGTYPLARDLYIINCQGYAGLGMGFTAFVTGDVGQRIVLKSGLVPVKFPPRKIRIRKKINND